MARSTGIYKYVTHKRGEPAVKEEMTASEVKQKIMKWENIKTTEEYNKYYDKMRNKIVNYRKMQEAMGTPLEDTRTVTQVLYSEAKRKNLFKDEYQESDMFQQYRTFTSASTGKSIQKIIEREKTARKKYDMPKKGPGNERKEITEEDLKKLSPMARSMRNFLVNDRFKGFIAASSQAQELVKYILDPYQLKDALAALAEKVHAKQTMNGKLTGKAIPAQQRSSGYADNGFDVESYLAELDNDPGQTYDDSSDPWA